MADERSVERAGDFVMTDRLIGGQGTSRQRRTALLVAVYCQRWALGRSGSTCVVCRCFGVMSRASPNHRPAARLMTGRLA